MEKTTPKFIILVLFGFLFFTTKVNGASLYLNPQNSNVLVGGTFDVSLMLNTEDTPVNIIESELYFPPDKLQLASPSFGESIIQMWPTPPIFSNETGRVYLVGGKPTPGINTNKGLVLTLTFKVVSSGAGQITFGKKTSVLANDGAGTDVLNNRSGANFVSTFPPSAGPVITSPTHPDQGRWYQNDSPVFEWTISPASEGFSFKIDSNPNGVPDDTSEGTSRMTSFNNLKNGIWYFHLKEKANGVWGGVSHYAVKIDNEAPEGFLINTSPTSKESITQSPIFRFSTSDSVSGLDHYEMKIVPLSSGDSTGVSFFEVTSPYQATNWKLGRYLVLVRAIDKAGNTRDESVTVSSQDQFSRFIGQEGVDIIVAVIPWSWIILIILLILIAISFIFFNLWMQHHMHLRYAIKEDLVKFVNFIRRK